MFFSFKKIQTVIEIDIHSHLFAGIDDGVKTLDVVTYSDGNEIDTLQQGHGTMNATINLQGNYPTDLNLIQQGNSNQTYSLTQNCQTSGGCSVTVTQQ